MKFLNALGEAQMSINTVRIALWVVAMVCLSSAALLIADGVGL